MADETNQVSAQAEPIGAAGVAGVRLPPPAASFSADRAAFVAQLNDGTDYDAEDHRQRDEAARLAEADGDTCDHRRTRIRLIEECECGMVIHEAVVQR